MRCKWVSWDSEGRPSCEHGPAISAGRYWRCGMKTRDNKKRYVATDKGREYRRQANASEWARSAKALYDLTRIRVS